MIFEAGIHTPVNGVFGFLANSLENNTKLRELWINVRDLVTPDEGNAFLRVLNNTADIPATFQSNHTLEAICSDDEEDSLPEDFTTLLHLNREINKREVARLKIIKAHFSGNNIEQLQPFMVMDSEVLPFAINWMVGYGINEGAGGGFDLLYQISRAVLSELLE